MQKAPASPMRTRARLAEPTLRKVLGASFNGSRVLFKKNCGVDRRIVDDGSRCEASIGAACTAVDRVHADTRNHRTETGFNRQRGEPFLRHPVIRMKQDIETTSSPLSLRKKVRRTDGISCVAKRGFQEPAVIIPPPHAPRI